MISKMKGRDFISFKDYTTEEIEQILSLASDLKRKHYTGEPHRLLEGKELGMLFFHASTRTRIAFETAMSHLGGHAQMYAAEHLHVFFWEDWKDTAQVMSRYLDGIMMRLFYVPGRENEYGPARQVFRLMADHANVPIINAQDDEEHPCQVMGDLLTYKEKFGQDFRKKKIAMIWCPCPKPITAGIPHSLAIGGGKLGMNIVYAYPEGYDMDPAYIDEGRKLAEQNGGSITITHDYMEAAKDADVIYAKSWKNVLQPFDKAEWDKRHEELLDWRIEKKHFKVANPNCLFMNAMPITREIDAANEIIDGPMSVLYDQAENRMHAQKAIMAMIM
ncbi:ornithine carbamoyltransferase [Chloroflexota bacterium]